MTLEACIERCKVCRAHGRYRGHLHPATGLAALVYADDVTKKDPWLSEAGCSWHDPETSHGASALRIAHLGTIDLPPIALGPLVCIALLIDHRPCAALVVVGRFSSETLLDTNRANVNI